MTIILVLLIQMQNTGFAWAFETNEFDKYMNIWTEKSQLASSFLLRAENAFKDGDELKGCAAQQKASSYGIEATKALIIAMKLSGSQDGLDNLETGMNKWKELRDFC